jgi:hypothetical protein
VAADLRFVAAGVREGVVTNVAYRLMEEQPAQTIALIDNFPGCALKPLRPVCRPPSGKLPRACHAGEASIIPAGHSLIAGRGQRVPST